MSLRKLLCVSKKLRWKKAVLELANVPSGVDSGGRSGEQCPAEQVARPACNAGGPDVVPPVRFYVPGQRVVLLGLVGHPVLNGQAGSVIQHCLGGEQAASRVAVRLDSGREVRVRLCNLDLSAEHTERGSRGDPG